MTLEERLAAVEQELADLRRLRLREAIKDLQEAATVTGYAQARLERSHQDHAEWLESHNKAMADHTQAMREIDERIRAIVSAIGELTVRIGIPPKPSM
jgi:chromosome segregation ATPase